MIASRYVPRTGRSGKPGFTLVELLVVCAIIAFMGALVAPNFRAYFFRAQRDKAKSDLSNTIRGAIFRSTQRRQIGILEFNIDSGSYYVIPPRDRSRSRYASQQQTIRRTLPEGFLFASLFRTEVGEAYTRGEVRFAVRPDGTTEDFELVLAELDADGNEVRQYYLMTVTGTTGQVAWTDLSKDEVRYTARW